MTAAPDRERVQCDVLIVGAGFSGSLLAWILAKHGLQVTLVDKHQHPRFRIGESSTPLADCLLESIAQEFELPALKPLSRWGTWQKHYASLRAGKKRGFSYFQHEPHACFRESDQHEHSLLVSASVSDSVADTHWHRGDVDHWICQQAVRAGVRLIEQFNLSEIRRTVAGWTLTDADKEIEACQWIDASGAAGLLAKHLGLAPSEDLRSKNAALFGHFANVASMDDACATMGRKDAGFPFWADDAAQHHLVRDGWIWMLRFGQYQTGQRAELTSVGFVAPQESFDNVHDLVCGDAFEDRGLQAWQALYEPYPTLSALFDQAKLVAPTSEGSPSLGWIPRCSRLWATAGCEDAVMLPGTVGVVDPLHSTGIAHSLYGVRRVARVLLESFQTRQRPQRSQPSQTASIAWSATHYAQQVVQEVKWIDELVSLAYACLPTQSSEFPLFTAACSFYFVAAIHSEEQFFATQTLPQGFLMVDDQRLRATVQEFRKALHSLGRVDARHRAKLSRAEVEQLTALAQKLIGPWNHVGLLDAQLRNRLARSAADKSPEAASGC